MKEKEKNKEKLNNMVEEMKKSISLESENENPELYGFFSIAIDSEYDAYTFSKFGNGSPLSNINALTSIMIRNSLVYEIANWMALSRKVFSEESFKVYIEALKREETTDIELLEEALELLNSEENKENLDLLLDEEADKLVS